MATGIQKYSCIAMGICTGTVILENNVLSFSQIKPFYSWGGKTHKVFLQVEKSRCRRMDVLSLCGDRGN